MAAPRVGLPEVAESRGGFFGLFLGRFLKTNAFD